MSHRAFVLDASVTASWLLPDEFSDAARGAYAKLRAAVVEAHAPDLWLWECGNLIANAVRHRRMAPDDALLSWSVLDAIRSRVDLARLEPAQMRACFALGIDHALSIYDAAYLWLAQSRGLPLLSHDTTLAAAARKSGVVVIAVGDLT